MSLASNHRILVVDDTAAIHDDFRKILGGIGTMPDALRQAESLLFESPVEASSTQSSFLVDSAYQGQEALQKVEAAQAAGCPYALAFVDVRMPPGWDGIETVGHLWKVCPDLQVVICTAYSDYSWHEIIQQLGKSDRLVILKKPFDNVEVLQLAHALTEKWRLLQQVTGKLENVESQLRQAQKMQAVGQLAAGVAHDFNNLLTIIQGHVQLLQITKKLEPDVTNALDKVVDATQRAAHLTRQLLTFSRKQALQTKKLDLNAVIRSIVDMLSRLLGEPISMHLALAETLPAIQADPGMLEQVILNLAVNSRDAMPQGGKLIIASKVCELDARQVKAQPQARPGRFVCLEVTDNGTGMDRETLDRIFEPFFTTKGVGKGTGLGLATVYGIVNQHEGWIEVASQLKVGTTFRIFLPTVNGSVAPAEPIAPAGTTPRGHETILVVEDEKLVREFLCQALKDLGYRVIAAPNGAEALAQWDQIRSQIDLVLTDMVMPEGISGWELAERLRANQPNLKVVYTSGYHPELFGRNLQLREKDNFLPKPYHPRTLAHTVRECLDA